VIGFFGKKMLLTQHVNYLLRVWKSQWKHTLKAALPSAPRSLTSIITVLLIQRDFATLVPVILANVTFVTRRRTTFVMELDCLAAHWQKAGNKLVISQALTSATKLVATRLVGDILLGVLWNQYAPVTWKYQLTPTAKTLL